MQLKTRYFGSKGKLIDSLHDVFGELDFDTAADFFGGSASVSLLLANMGKHVHFNDGFKFNAAMARAVLAKSEDLPSRDEVVRVIESVKLCSGFISSSFDGIFYTDEENQWLDGVSIKIQQLDGILKDVVFYCVAQACLKKRPFNLFHRANLYLRQNTDVSRKFGNHYTWEKTFLEHSKLSLNELYSIKRPEIDVKVLITAGDAVDTECNADLLYIDPPYLDGNTSEDYVKRYHFLEGLYCYDEWSYRISDKYRSKNIDGCEFIANMSSLPGFKKTLFEVLSKFTGKYVVISYVESNHESYSYIISLLNDLNYEVKIYGHKHRHALSKKEIVEVTIVGGKDEE